MAKLDQKTFATVRDILDEDGCFTGTFGELADRCDLQPMLVGKAFRNPVMVAAFAGAGWAVELLDDDSGRSIVTISRC